MRMKKYFFILFVLMFTALSSADYRFSYLITGRTNGKFLLFVRYKQFYQVGASAIFVKDNHDFSLKEIDAPSYMMKTHGKSEKSLSLLTAYTQAKEALLLRESLLESMSVKFPSVWSNCKEKINLRDPFIVNQPYQGLLKFRTNGRGKITPSQSLITLTQKNYKKTFFTYFNVYKIMSVMLKAYNHNYLPKGFNLLNLSDLKGKTWKSEKVNFDDIFMGVMKLSSDKMHKYVTFEQRKDISFVYRVIAVNEENILILGSVAKKVKVWKNLKLESAVRRITLSLKTGEVMSDKIEISLADKNKNNFWTYKAGLNRKD